jgi:Spy/CpxP family protein refolding chaperone
VSTSPRAAAALLIVGALLAGIVLGVAGDRAWMHIHRQQRPPRLDRLVEHLDRILNLTAQQKETVKQIVERRHARIEAITANMRPQMRQEIESMNAEIEKVLNPEQRQKFQSLSQRMHQRHRGMRPGGPPPPVPSPH